MSAKILLFAPHAGTLSSDDASSKSSGETRPADARMIGTCHLPGTALRSRHFSIVRDFTPNEIAISSISSQSNVVFMVRDYSDKSSECQRHFGGSAKVLNFLQFSMAKEPNLLSRAAIRSRAKEAFKTYRTSRKWSMREMAVYLGVTPKNYEAYEGKPTRGVPPEVIAVFCHNTSADINWIMFGKKPLRKAI